MRKRSTFEKSRFIKRLPLQFPTPVSQVAIDVAVCGENFFISRYPMSQVATWGPASFFAQLSSCELSSQFTPLSSPNRGQTPTALILRCDVVPPSDCPPGSGARMKVTLISSFLRKEDLPRRSSTRGQQGEFFTQGKEDDTIRTTLRHQ